MYLLKVFFFLPRFLPKHHIIVTSFSACTIFLQVAGIDVKQETPVNHGEIICFSVYSGPQATFGNGKSCIWVDVLDGGGKDMLAIFAPFFEDPSIKKVIFLESGLSLPCLVIFTGSYLSCQNFYWMLSVIKSEFSGTKWILPLYLS